jgi:TonB family protein
MQTAAALCALLLVASLVEASQANAQVRPVANTTEATLRDANAFERALRDQYPEYHERAGVGGTVRLKVFVNTAGTADSVLVVSSSGVSALDWGATKATRNAKFKPAVRSTGPTASWVDLTLSFGGGHIIGYVRCRSGRAGHRASIPFLARRKARQSGPCLGPHPDPVRYAITSSTEQCGRACKRHSSSSFTRASDGSITSTVGF